MASRRETVRIGPDFSVECLSDQRTDVRDRRQAFDYPSDGRRRSSRFKRSRCPCISVIVNVERENVNPAHHGWTPAIAELQRSLAMFFNPSVRPERNRSKSRFRSCRVQALDVESTTSRTLLVSPAPAPSRMASNASRHFLGLSPCLA